MLLGRRLSAPKSVDRPHPFDIAAGGPQLVMKKRGRPRNRKGAMSTTGKSSGTSHFDQKRQKIIEKSPSTSFTATRSAVMTVNRVYQLPITFGSFCVKCFRILKVDNSELSQSPCILSHPMSPLPSNMPQALPFLSKPVALQQQSSFSPLSKILWSTARAAAAKLSSSTTHFCDQIFSPSLPPAKLFCSHPMQTSGNRFYILIESQIY